MAPLILFGGYGSLVPTAVRYTWGALAVYFAGVRALFGPLALMLASTVSIPAFAMEKSLGAFFVLGLLILSLFVLNRTITQSLLVAARPQE